MAEPRRILATITSNPARLEQLHAGVAAVARETGIPLALDTSTSRDEYLGMLPTAEALLTYRLDPDQFAAGSRLRWVHIGGAGIDRSLFDELVTSDLTVTMSKGIHADVMAEYALMALLGLAVDLPRIVDAQHRKAWISRDLRPRHHSIAGKRLLVIGLGAIGLPVARLAASVGMRVRGVKRTPWVGELPDGLEAVHAVDELDALLPDTDYLLLIVPATPHTAGLISEDRLRRLPADAGIVNMGRGRLIDEEALYRVLEDGHLRGAVLDTFTEEPLPEYSPLWHHPRVLVTPHISGNFDTYTARVIDQFCDNLTRWLTGEPIPYPIDREAGY